MRIDEHGDEHHVGEYDADASDDDDDDEVRRSQKEVCKRMKLIYVAGPYRAPTPEGVEHNILKARCAAKILTRTTAQAGVAYIVPHLLTAGVDSGQSDEYWLAATMEMMRRCDAIVMLEGFENSKGSMAELAEAQRLGKRVFYHNDPRLLDEIREWAKT